MNNKTCKNNILVSSCAPPLVPKSALERAGFKAIINVLLEDTLSPAAVHISVPCLADSDEQHSATRFPILGPCCKTNVLLRIEEFLTRTTVHDGAFYSTLGHSDVF